MRSWARDSKTVRFSYQGLKDRAPRERLVQLQPPGDAVMSFDEDRHVWGVDLEKPQPSHVQRWSFENMTSPVLQTGEMTEPFLV